MCDCVSCAWGVGSRDLALTMQTSLCERREGLRPGLNNQICEGADLGTCAPSGPRDRPKISVWSPNSDRLNGGGGPRAQELQFSEPQQSGHSRWGETGGSPTQAGEGARRVSCIIQQLLISHYSP